MRQIFWKNTSHSGKSGKKDEKALAEEELSDEDKKLKEELELCVERLTENDAKLYTQALASLR